MLSLSLSHTHTHTQDLLVTVFENGELLKDYTFDEVREQAELPLVRAQRHT